jgi:DDE family transposase
VVRFIAVKRRETVEHPFGTLKMRMGATHFLMKRLPKVATEMALHVLAYNLTESERCWSAFRGIRETGIPSRPSFPNGCFRGRVEMWRGGSRLNISVSASFV